MNKTKIEYVDYSWNPITGCFNGCFYCYARRIYKRFKKSFEPTFHPIRLAEPAKIKKPSNIFVCSVSDFWGKGIKPFWRRCVYHVINQCPRHTFFILTKQPQRIRDFKHVPENCWVGVSVSAYRDWARIVYLIRKFKSRTFISIEPLIPDKNPDLADHVTSYFFLANWIIVGAMTGPGSKKYAPNSKLIKYILDTCKRCKIPIFMKNNLKPYWQSKLKQEWPK